MEFKEALVKLENETAIYFEAIDGNFGDEIQVFILKQESSVYTRMKLSEEIDIDVKVDGITDEYYYQGKLTKPITAIILG